MSVTTVGELLDFLSTQPRAAGGGRRNGGCTHRSCASCPRFALAWREKVLHDVEYGQTSLNIWS